MAEFKFMNRELTWLSFNHRVLQEAKDKRVPLLERIKFMAIFSSNLDEFYRVRVASLRYLLELKRKIQKKIEFDPVILLKKIQQIVEVHQEELGDIFRNEILNDLEKNNIYLIDESKLNQDQQKYIEQYFKEEVHPYLQPSILVKDKVSYFLKNNALYLTVKLTSKIVRGDINSNKVTRANYALLEIPTRLLPRFIVLPDIKSKKYVIFLDDIIRFNLPLLFPGYQIDSAYSVKLTRDAEIYIDDEFSGDLLLKIKKGIEKRKTGVPARFLYDNKMPEDHLKFLRSAFSLNKEDLVPGGRYHNFSDFFSFPSLGSKDIQYKNIPSLKIPQFEGGQSIFSIIKQDEFLLYYPYHFYDYILRFLKEASSDKDVSAINITLYRVASDSKITRALIQAANNGKKVTAFVEIKARFDEEANLFWAAELEKACVKVLYSFPGLKVHSKLCLIERKDNYYAYLSTGNFNEKTAKIYTDFGFFTTDKKLTKEIKQVFKYLEGKTKTVKFNHLLVAPFNMRKKFNELINNEIENAKKGKKAEIILKLNSLQDQKMIEKLYSASNAGVHIKIIVRGICCLLPGVKNLSENIEAISIVDRFLEHTRVYVFHNDGDEKYYIASADWMKRNLSRRIEVGFPVYDRKIEHQLREIINIQLSDNVKARIIDKKQKNEFRKNDGVSLVQSQLKIYDYLKNI
ncbi:polyphosphate kinase 1 [Calditrichota bacterium]